MRSYISIPNITSTLQIRSFHIEVVAPGWSFKDHYHHSFELLYCWEGAVTQWLGKQPVLFQSGDWLLFPPGTRHKTLNTALTPFTYMSFMFDIDDPDFRRELKSLSRSFVSKEDAAHTQLPFYIHQLDEIIQNHMVTNSANTVDALSLSNRLELQAYILLMMKDLIFLLRNQLSTKEENSSMSTFEMDMANHLEQYLIQSLQDPDLSVQEIYKKMGISRSQGTKFFHKVFGISPRQYVTSQRLLLAKEKLVQTDQSIESIAMELGFSSLSHFSRQFKLLTGVSPLQYRPKFARVTNLSN